MRADLGPLAIEFGLLCDDVRREDNGKLLLIGVYGGDIQFGSFPALAALRLVTKLDSRDGGARQVRFRFFLNDSKISEVVGEVATGKGEQEMAFSPPIMLNLFQEGLIRVEAQYEDGAPQTFLTLPLRLSAPTAS
jgi:hypothetical protein